MISRVEKKIILPCLTLVVKLDEKVENEDQVEALVISIPRYMHSEPECVKAKEKELQNWEDFGVYIEVEDEGQDLLNTNWVLVEKEGIRLTTLNQCRVFKQHLVKKEEPFSYWK